MRQTNETSKEGEIQRRKCWKRETIKIKKVTTRRRRRQRGTPGSERRGATN